MAAVLLGLHFQLHFDAFDLVVAQLHYELGTGGTPLCKPFDLKRF